MFSRLFGKPKEQASALASLDRLNEVLLPFKMSLSVVAQTAEIGCGDPQDVAAASLSNLPVGNVVDMGVEEEDEEDEDMDFNPFLRGETPSEASSSLSSENEGLGDTVDGKIKDASALSRPINDTLSCNRDSKNEDEVVVMQTRLLPHGGQGRDGPKEGELTCPEGHDKELTSENGSDAADCMARKDALQKTVVGIDEEDAICRRTRARHSLAKYTLEELETFLQESDDDDELHNVDDEEEYHKFLAAVLLEEPDDGQACPGNENIDEDEDNDADFEIEIEEALESDVDEGINHNGGENYYREGDAHIPETRQKKRLKESAGDKKSYFGQAKMPLRPLLPYVSNPQTAAFPVAGWQLPASKSFPYSAPSVSGADSVNGFTAHQIGQLYCLIHEHVQLLIQVFSVSILDPSKQQVATAAKKLILEMIDKREEALVLRNVPFPGFCFRPPHLRSSLQFDSRQTASCSQWTPSVDNPVLSILDVVPLRLVKSYMTDVSDSVLRYRRSHLEDVADRSQWIREPLFPLPTLDTPKDTNTDIPGGASSMLSNIQPLLPASPGQVQPKKSLAATLVENTKKQSVALVPRDIAKSAQRFYPLFNSALFPHKPPVPAVANRVLFTDAEDGLLAMGLMEYNNDWAAIQQHFLPCKSKHQIFVRQKNRSSSKAPENPIKAVRRMKTSPLTADEQAHIYEGLKLFKHDWLLVWKFFVPHRDPSLLPRQWRIATGTQKSYRKSEGVKEKRRLYEAERKKFKASMGNCQTSEKEVDNGDNSSGDIDGEDEAYVHEAFLAESEPGSSKCVPYDTAFQSMNRSNMQSSDMMQYKGNYIGENCAFTTNECGELRQESGGWCLKSSLHDVHSPSFPQLSFGASSKQLTSNSISRPSNGHLVTRSCQARKSRNVRVVKLAPDLPPVNLPSSVRIISQSAFKSYNSKSSCTKVGNTATKNHVSRFPQATKAGTINSGGHANKFPDNNGLDTSCRQHGGTLTSQFGAEENTSESDLHMHPLLFQVPEDRFSSYFPMNCHTSASSTYNFFPGNPLHSDPSALRPRFPVKSVDCVNVNPHSEAPSNLCTIDFHPLLQRTDNLSGDSAMVPSAFQPSGGRSPRSTRDKFFNMSDCTMRSPVVSDGQMTTSAAAQNHNEKEKLDLDIRLSSAGGREITEGRDVNEHQSVDAAIPLEEHRELEKRLLSNFPYSNCSDKFPEVSATNNSCAQSFTCSQKDISSLGAVPPSNNGAGQYMAGLYNDSLPGIVMEQEELSDSEEEVEQVEFEREEIDDSEEDELGRDQSTETQNKEFPFFTSTNEEVQADHDLRTLQSRYLEKESVGNGENCTSPSRVSQGPCHSKLSCLNPNHDSVQRSTPCRRSNPALQNKKQSAEGSGLHPLRTVQSKVAGTFRKPRKRF